MGIANMRKEAQAIPPTQVVQAFFAVGDHQPQGIQQGGDGQMHHSSDHRIQGREMYGQTEEVEEVFKEADLDHDGKLDYKEFVDFWKNK